MKEQFSIVVSVATLVLMLLGGAYGYGSLNQHVADLTELERQSDKRLELLDVKVDKLGERISRIEGYLEKDAPQLR